MNVRTRRTSSGAPRGSALVAAVMIAAAAGGCCHTGDQPAEGLRDFADGFEGAVTLEDLFPADASRWTDLQLLGNDANVVEPTTDVVRTGSTALRTIAGPNETDVSKADVARNGLYFVTGDDLWVSAAYFLVGGTSAENLFLLDIESTAAAHAAPGRRVMLSGPEGLVKLESKGAGRDLEPPAGAGTPFPTDRWVEVVVHLRLAAGDAGRAEVWLDDEQVLAGRGKNLPCAGAVYDRIQFGLTANGGADLQTLYVDDAIVGTIPLR